MSLPREDVKTVLKIAINVKVILNVLNVVINSFCIEWIILVMKNARMDLSLMWQQMNANHVPKTAAGVISSQTNVMFASQATYCIKIIKNVIPIVQLIITLM
jgi:hypothetical protein